LLIKIIFPIITITTTEYNYYVKKNKYFGIPVKYILYSFLLFILTAFNFQDKFLNGWYKQTLPNINNIPISDICFVDSLVGFIVTKYTGPNINSYILKTTNGGNNWNIIRTDNSTYNGFFRVYFLNLLTGYVAGQHGLEKTINGGANWFNINLPILYPNDFAILNEDTIWCILSEQLTGGVFRTTNGGQNWIQQVNLNIYNPQKIYMIDKNNGFITDLGYTIYRTSNGGFNWTQTDYGSGHYYYDMHFYDSTIGYRAYALDSMLQKTTNRGISWFSTSPFPIILGTPYYSNYIRKFTLLNKDTLWVSGGYGIYPNGVFGVVYKTTNGGFNWGYQMPDTSFHLNSFYHIIFTNKSNGWAFNNTNTGIHTITGGSDTTIYTNIIKQITNNIFQFELYQNYPNPFNSITNIKLQMLKRGFTEIKIYDLTGKLIEVIFSNNLNSGEHTFKFDASDLASGLIFCSLFVDGKRIDTKKLILLK
jgi:photosystem II stability/assembly factor-like uncharacterized protein